MNIYAKKGDKCVFCNPDNGTDWDIKHAAKYLEKGQTYVVAEAINPSAFSSSVYLEGFPIPFNTVMFEDIKKSPPMPENEPTKPSVQERIGTTNTQPILTRVADMEKGTTFILRESRWYFQHLIDALLIVEEGKMKHPTEGLYHIHPDDMGEIIAHPACAVKKIEELNAILAELKAIIANLTDLESNRNSWKCFHCGKVFITDKEAREHFGERDANGLISRPAACLEMLIAIREVLEEFGYVGIANAGTIKRLLIELRKKSEDIGTLRNRAEQAEAALLRSNERSLSCCFCGQGLKSLEALKAHSDHCEKHPLMKKWMDAESKCSGLTVFMQGLSARLRNGNGERHTGNLTDTDKYSELGKCAADYIENNLPEYPGASLLSELTRLREFEATANADLTGLANEIDELKQKLAVESKHNEIQRLELSAAGERIAELETDKESVRSDAQMRMENLRAENERLTRDLEKGRNLARAICYKHVITNDAYTLSREILPTKRTEDDCWRDWSRNEIVELIRLEIGMPVRDAKSEDKP